MNALALVLSPPIPRITRLTLTERRAINQLLNRWGNWMEKNSEFTGYPGTNILESYIGSDPQPAGHRILCLEMPTDIYATHHCYLRLPEQEQRAVWLWYVPVMLPDGRVRTTYERAVTAGIDYDTLCKQVSRARLRIMGIQPD